MTYSVGNSPCDVTVVRAIEVIPQASAAWTSPGTVCEAGGTVTLDALVTGTTGGSWAGTGVTGGIFNPSGLDGTFPVTYSVGTSPCEDELTLNISVLPAVDASWQAPATICEVEGIIDLSALVTGTVGGNWSGTGVTGSSFDPSGLSGQTIAITYSVGQNECEDSSTQNIQISNVSAAWAAPDTICENNGIIALNTLVSGNAGGSWTGTGVTGSQFSPVGISGTVTITYTVGTAPCQDSESHDIFVRTSPPDPTVSASDSEICIGEGTLITASGSGSVTYQVYDAAVGGNLLGQTPLPVSPTSTQTYHVLAEDGDGCVNLSGRQPVTVTVNPLPVADAGDNTVVCTNDSVTLTASGGTQYLWSTSEPGPSIMVSPIEGTWYAVTVTDANGCSDSDSVFVDVFEATWPIAVLDTGTTENIDPIIIAVLDNDTSDAEVTVSIVTGPMNGEAAVSADGEITYTPNQGYVGSDSLSYAICDGFCQKVCDTAWVLITVIDEVTLFIPSGFSPNGDMINDDFVIRGLHRFPDHHIVILNRWGDIVYEAAPYENDWHGQTPNAKLRMAGDEVVNGTYFYIFKPYGSDQDIRRGTIELRRN